MYLSPDDVSTQGEVLLLLNGHKNVELLGSLESLVAEAELESGFRLVITCQYSADLPDHVLHMCTRVTTDPPRVRSTRTWFEGQKMYSCMF